MSLQTTVLVVDLARGDGTPETGVAIMQPATSFAVAGQALITPRPIPVRVDADGDSPPQVSLVPGEWTIIPPEGSRLPEFTFTLQASGDPQRLSDLWPGAA